MKQVSVFNVVYSTTVTRELQQTDHLNMKVVADSTEQAQAIVLGLNPGAGITFHGAPTLIVSDVLLLDAPFPNVAASAPPVPEVETAQADDTDDDSAFA